MQAVILAAGLGSRLRPITEQIPKCLVEVNGVPIIVSNLDALSRHGVRRAIIVLGHLGQMVRDRLGHSWKGLEIVYVENPDYAKTNNVYSLWTAREYLDCESILMECDLFFEDTLIGRLLSHRGQNVAMVGEFKPYMDGTVVEVDKSGMITRMILSKEHPKEFSFLDKFKTINIYLFTEKFLKEVFTPNLDLYVKTQENDQYYELILTVLIYMGHHRIQAVFADGLKWMEIDDFSDIQRAKILFSEKPTLYQHVQSLHGGFWRYDFQDFSYLYNLFFPPPSLVHELRVNVSSLLGQYPSAQREIAGLLAHWTGLEPNCLAVGNGASEIIAILKKDFVKKIAIPIPTFNEYETHLSRDQIEYFLCSPEDFCIDVDAYARAVERSGCNVALIINPNNPTAQYLEPAKIEYLLKRLSMLDLILLDESFIDFVSLDPMTSMTSRLGEFKNLVILKSLSKNLGIPGLRLGYAASSNRKLIERIRTSLSVWNVNSFAEYFLEVLTKYRSDYTASCIKTIEARDYFYEKLSSIPGIKSFAPQSNFVFVRLDNGMDGRMLKERLFLDSNILIKDCSNKTGLESGHYVRFSVRRKEETDLFIPSFQRALKLGLSG